MERMANTDNPLNDLRNSQAILTVVLRSAGERSSEACAHLICRQVPIASFAIVNERPFEEALKRTFEIGIERGTKWTMTVDADVLLCDGCVSSLIRAAESMPSNYIQLEGRIFDKIFGIYRQAGHRIYRTALLPIALKHIPEAGKTLRPEFFTLQQMGQSGYPSRRIAAVVGLHDFEQYYLDLYRKSFVHARKHTWLIGPLIERCTRYLHQDADFLVILKGLWDGLVTADTVSLDNRAFQDKGLHALDELGIEEKTPLADLGLFLMDFHNFYSKLVSEYPIPIFSVQDEPPACETMNEGWFAKVQQRFERHGPLKGSAAAVGALLKRVGRYLDR